MVAKSLMIGALASALVWTSAGPGWAQAAPDYQPQVGQQGKDVVWVPTAQALVDRMLDLAKVKPDDFLMDLGSGDGRTVITAARRGITAMGVEYNPDMVALSKRNAQNAGVADKATFVQADLFATDFSKATVVTMFLLPDINRRLRPKILDMKPGTRVVSNSFDMGDWSPEETVQANENCTSYCKAFLWIVPAKVEGKWRTDKGEISFEQKYQMVSGTVSTGNVVAPITDGRILADKITFSAGGAQYSGVIADGSIAGVAKSAQGETPFRATRAP